jgi:hypothetical protein
MSSYVRTYSLAEVAAMVLPPEWTGGVRWLARRLNRGEISGYKVGRVWRMTDDDVQAFIESGRNTNTPMPADDCAPAASASDTPTTVFDALSERSPSSPAIVSARWTHRMKAANLSAVVTPYMVRLFGEDDGAWQLVERPAKMEKRPVRMPSEIPAGPGRTAWLDSVTVELSDKTERFFNPTDEV